MKASLAIRLGVLLVVSAAVGVGAAFGLRPALPFGGEPRPEDDGLAAAIDAQLEQARSAGIAESRPGESGRAELTPRGTETERSFPLTVARGECVSFVVASAGCYDVSQVVLRRGRLNLALDATTPDHAPHQVRWCAWNAPTRVMAVVRMRGGVAADFQLPWAAPPRSAWCTDPEEARRAVLRWEVRRGPADPIAGTSGLGVRVLPGAGVEADREAAEAWLEAHPGEGEPLGAPQDSLLSRGALLLPRVPVTCQALYQLANVGADTLEHPRVAPAPPGAVEPPACPPTGVDPGSLIDALYRPMESRRDRILAVVDRGGLGAACVEVRIARLLRGRRVDAPIALALDARGAPLRQQPLPEAGEPFVHVDRACPAEGLVAYLAPGNDPADYRVEVRSLPAPEGATARPAPAIGAPFPGAPPPELASREAECERLHVNPIGDSASSVTVSSPGADACLAAADAYRSGASVPQSLSHAARLYRAACDQGSMPGCAMLGHAYGVGEGVEVSPAEAARLYALACDGGALRACAYLGDAERRTPGAPPEAMERARQWYARACEGGVESACVDARELVSRGLLPDATGAPPAPAE